MSPLARIRQAAACSVFVFAVCPAMAGPSAADVADAPAQAVEQSTPARVAATPPSAAPASAEPPKAVQLAPNVTAQISRSALLSVEATAKADILQISIQRVADKRLINTDDVTVTVDGKNQPVSRDRGTVYELPINDLRGDGVRDIDVTVAHDGIREILSGKISVAEVSSTQSMWLNHKQVAWWVLNIGIVLAAAMAFSGRKSKEEDKEEE